MRRHTHRAAAIATMATIWLSGSGCAAAPPQRDAPATQPSAAILPAVAPRDAPVAVRIPAIGVDSPVVAIGTDPAGALAPPPTTDVVGWYAAGPAPGDRGPALIAAHVDSRAGPGVFFHLRDVRVGDHIDISRADGTTVTFSVTRRTQTPKAAFPTDLVYNPTPAPELRVVTCGGTFDRTIRSYRDNILLEAVADNTSWVVSPA